jgi:hypothetical protein
MTCSRIRWILAASLLTSIHAVATAQTIDAPLVAPMSSEAQQAAKAVDAFHAKLSGGDGVAAAALLADDALILRAAMPNGRGPSTLRIMLAQMPPMQRLFHQGSRIGPALSRATRPGSSAKAARQERTRTSPLIA